MELLIALIFVVVVVVYLRSPRQSRTTVARNTPEGKEYFYTKKDDLMTHAEAEFFHRLQKIAADKYYVFPQIHLSALLRSETKGKYWKAAFQRINRTSVDFVLVYKDTLRVAYAIELDDWSHDSVKRQARDEGVNKMLSDAGIRLVRFRDIDKLSDGDIINRFIDSQTVGM